MKNQTFYTNLPPKEKEALQKTIDALTKTAYTDDFQFNAGEYDASIGFFVKRGFSRTSAEGIAYIILRQAKIDSISPQEILDKITYATPTQLSELITIVLNSNRYKSSKLGVRQTRTTKETVSRNILD